MCNQEVIYKVETLENNKSPKLWCANKMDDYTAIKVIIMMIR